MAFSYIKKNVAVGKAVQLLTVSASNLIVAMLQWEDSATSPTLSDGTNAPDAYSTVASYSTQQYIRFAYWLSSPKSGTVTYTWTASGGGGHTAHVFEMSAGATVSLAHIDAGASAASGDTATSASETSAAASVVGFGGAGWYEQQNYVSATLDGGAVDQYSHAIDTGYSAAGTMTMRIMSNPGTYTAVIVGSNDNAGWCADLIAFSEAAAGGSQFARPVSDVAAGGWTASTGSDLYAMVDESAASDADYITSDAAPAADAAVVTLGSLSTPAAGTVTLRVRAKYV
jgi:hypothetical protein